MRKYWSCLESENSNGRRTDDKHGKKRQKNGMKNMMICLMNFRPQKVKQIEKNEIGSYLEEAEAFYKRVEKRRKKSHDKKN